MVSTDGAQIGHGIERSNAATRAFPAVNSGEQLFPCTQSIWNGCNGMRPTRTINGDLEARNSCFERVTGVQGEVEMYSRRHATVRRRPPRGIGRTYALTPRCSP